jgi:hypothetical protein
VGREKRKGEGGKAEEKDVRKKVREREYERKGEEWKRKKG